MPELPDILLYLHALRPRILGRRVEAIRLASPFLLRTVEPPLTALVGRRIVDLHRLGKRIAMEADGELFLVFHLMIAGRFRWVERSAGRAGPAARGPAHAGNAGPAARGPAHDGVGDAGPAARGPAYTTRGPADEARGPAHAARGASTAAGRPAIPGKIGLLAVDLENGTLILTEAGTRRRASLHVAEGRDALREHDRGGLEVLDASKAAFVEALQRESHTLKRTLTDPRIFSGIGNAYSDEILHAARLSPFKLSRTLSDDELDRLFTATIGTLRTWISRLQEETGGGFPEKVTAFRPGMAVHGRHGQPCPVCGSPVQRIVYAQNEANYCATCQTDGRLLADRSLSRLLREDWPRTLDELEKRKQN